MFPFKVWEIGSICCSSNGFFSKFKFLSGSRLNNPVRASPLILLLSMSIFEKLVLPLSTLINSLAPSLSMSLFDNCSSSREWHLEMNSHMILHPFEEILLLDKLRTCKLYLFLFCKAFITISTPSSPMLFPERFSSFIVFDKDRQSSRVLIPWNPISFFFKEKTSRYFLSLRAAPKATAPSAKTPLLLKASSVMYFLFSSTLLTAFAPPGPMKF